MLWYHWKHFCFYDSRGMLKWNRPMRFTHTIQNIFESLKLLHFSCNPPTCIIPYVWLRWFCLKHDLTGNNKNNKTWVTFYILTLKLNIYSSKWPMLGIKSLNMGNLFSLKYTKSGYGFCSVLSNNLILIRNYGELLFHFLMNDENSTIHEQT